VKEYDWERRFDDFTAEMKAKIKANLPEKGLSWRTCDLDYLSLKLMEYRMTCKYLDLANLAFMLWDRK
jgi:hypothetical protein